MFDQKLYWKAHIQQLKSSCNWALILKQSLSSTGWGANQRTLMMIHRSLIRSKTDYICLVYILTKYTKLVRHESVANEAMIIANWCFKSHPTTSLHVMTEDPPLQIRRVETNLNYYYKVKTLL